MACVLRSGGRTYDESWVRKLRDGVVRNLDGCFRFVCLTDLPGIEGIETQPLREGWPGWWSKVELFKPGRFEGPVLYLDLDMLVCGAIAPLAGPWPGLVMLRDKPRLRHVANSGLMWWDGADPCCAMIYQAFKFSPLSVMQTYSGRYGDAMLGDQAFIARILAQQARPAMFWQDALPADWFLEFSYGGRINPLVLDAGQPPDVRVCYSLGCPKFNSSPDLSIVRQHWRAS